jgi:hypothetical protein
MGETTKYYFCLQSSELGPPHPLTRRQVCPQLLVPEEGTHSLAGEGWGGPNADDGTYTEVQGIYVLYFVGETQLICWPNACHRVGPGFESRPAAMWIVGYGFQSFIY